MDASRPNDAETAAAPVAFAGCAGVYHPAAGETAILMAPAWGFEDLTIRAGWRAFALRLAGAGFPTLRYDPPGAGDSLGEDGAMDDLEPARRALEAAASELRRLSGARGLVLVGHGLGANLALDRAGAVGARGLVALAPMAEGRAGPRALAIWSSMIASFLRIPEERPEGVALNVAGFRMSETFVAALKAWRLPDAPVPGLASALLLARPGSGADAAMGERLARCAARARTRDYVGHDSFVAHQTTSRAPFEDFDAVIAWLRENEPAFLADAAPATAPAPPGPAVLEGGGFCETAMKLGPDERLFGVLCAPAGAARAVVVMPNAGYNPHIGWARSQVAVARALAAHGVASLRLDLGGIGESRAAPGAPADPLYSDSHIADLDAAIDAMAARGLGPVAAAGRCSGAWCAVRAVAANPRARGLVAVNTLRLIWDPRETLEAALTTGSSSLGDLGARGLSLHNLRRLARGELDLPRLARRLARKLTERGEAVAARWSGAMTTRGRLRRRIRDDFAGFRARGVEVALVYAANDGGRDELALYFGPDGRDLAGDPNVAITIVEGAEHNMTADAARAAMLRAILDVAEKMAPAG